MDLGLAGKVALISGGTEGIGLASARMLAAEGVDVFLVARTESRLVEVAEEIRSQFGVRCEWATADYQNSGEAGRAVEDGLARMGRVDILVNNAGRYMGGSLATASEEWHQSLQLNFVSHLEATRVIVPVMKNAGWGRIINVLGMQFRQPVKISVSTTAKSAMVTTFKALSREVALDGITVNTVTVGYIDSRQMLETSESRRDEISDMIPMQKFGRPEDAAAAVVFLASELAAYTTGSTFAVDGGLTHSA